MTGPVAQAPLELWGGVECTVNRVGDAFRDQLELTGTPSATTTSIASPRWASGRSATRCSGSGRRRRAGARRLAWSDAGWPGADARYRPIVALVHHGSGPAKPACSTRAFPSGSRSRRAVAERYPWVDG